MSETGFSHLRDIKLVVWMRVKLKTTKKKAPVGEINTTSTVQLKSSYHYLQSKTRKTDLRRIQNDQNRAKLIRDNKKLNGKNIPPNKGQHKERAYQVR